MCISELDKVVFIWKCKDYLGSFVSGYTVCVWVERSGLRLDPFDTSWYQRALWLFERVSFF